MKIKLYVWFVPVFIFAFTSADDPFFDKASRIHLMEIQAGQLAVAKGNPEVKKIGRQLITDHTVAENELIVLAKSQKITITSEPGHDRQAILDNLKTLTDQRFDSAYMSSQFADQKEEEILYSEESKTGSNEAAKTYAGKYLPKIQMHLQMFVGNGSAITSTMDSVKKK